ncbi:MAG: DUF4386 family protein [Chloroflexi bacterium]|nr:DUF4386 family protein [Chloroflexota bacterium]
MNTSQKAAGIGALLQGLSFVIVLVLIFAVLPGFGFQGPNDFADPAKALPFIASQSLLAFRLFAGDILFAVFLILTVMGLYERLQTHSPALVRLATAAGLITTASILANGTIGSSLFQLARLYPQNREVVETAFLTLTLVSSNGAGILTGGIFAYGWWAVLVSWVALRAGTFPKVLNYLGILFGLAGIGAILIQPLGFLGVFVGLVWCLWLGVVLLRA